MDTCTDCQKIMTGPDGEGQVSHSYIPCEHHKHMAEYASPVINNIPSGEGCNGGHGYDNGLGALAGILPIALLAPLLTGRGFGREEGGGRALEGVIAEQVGNLRHDIGESTVSTLKESFQAALDATKAGFEAKVSALQATNSIENKIGECCAETQKAFCGLRAEMDNKFCHTDELIEAKFNHMELENRDEKIRALEARIAVQDTVTAILTSLGVPSPIVPFAKKV